MMVTASENVHTAYLAVGANLGDRVSGCRRGVDLLEEAGDVKVVEHSPYYYSAPMHYTKQPWFVNAVFEVATALDPVSLLARLKTIETAAGRRKGGIRFGPRMLDLDLIFYEDAVIRTHEIIVPHPRMHERAFVLRPLCDIAPDLVHPVLGRAVRELLSGISAAEQKCYALDDKVFDKTVSV